MSTRSTAFLLALLAFASFAWLSPQDPINAQIVTRLGLTLSILDRGKLDIDPWAERTIDKASFEGHFYADKVPGHPLLGLPSAAIAKLVMGAQGADLDSTKPEVFARYAYWVTVGTNGILSALAVGVLFLTARQLGASQAGAVFGSFALAFATPFLGWSTAFFAHSVSASLLLLVFAAIYAGLGVGNSPAPTPAIRHPMLLGLGVGLLLGITMAVDLTTTPLGVILGLLGLALAFRRGGWSLLLPFIGGLAIGGMLGLLPLLVYNQLAFHSPFKVGYGSVVGFEGMQQGFFGLTLPDPTVLWEILFGLYRGLLPLSPVLLLAPFGVFRMLRLPEARLAGAVVIAAAAIYLWINSSYFYWNGGWSTGPRHIVAMLPFLGLALCFAWPKTAVFKALAIVLLVLGLAMSLLSATVTMFAPEDFRNPIFEELLPRFVAEGRWLRALPVVLVWLVVGAVLAQADRIAPMQSRRIAAGRV